MKVMKNKKYLFLDVEWNQPEGVYDEDKNEIVSIGIVQTDQYLNEEKIFFKLVRPENIETITETTYKLLHLHKNTLLEAEPIRTISKLVYNEFHNFDLLVVWNMDAFQVFQHTMSKLGLAFAEEKVFCLQPLMERIIENGGTVSFSKALSTFKIPYEWAHMHIAKHDAKYLKTLYAEAKERYIDFVRLNHPGKYVRSVSTDTVHRATCHHARRLAPENSEPFRLTQLFEGHRFCGYCSKRQRITKEIVTNAKKRPPRDYKKVNRFDDEAIQQWCADYNLTCNISDGLIFVKSPCSSWRVYHDYRKVTAVYHESYYKFSDKEYRRKKVNEGYHRQKVAGKSMTSVLQYIYYHDQNRMSGVVKQKSKVELLLEQVEKERLLREAE